MSYDPANPRATRYSILALLLVACGAEALEPAVVDDSGPTLPFATEAAAAIDFLGRVVPDVALTTLSGEPTTLFDGRDERVLVVAFTQVGCPIAQRYGPTLARLHANFRDRGVGFIGVDASPQDSPSEIEEQASRLKLEFPFLKDEPQDLLRALDVQTSTEVLVLDAERRLRYRGAIDDSLAVGTVRARSEHDYLSAAIEAVLAGAAPGIQATDAPGCIITRIPAEEFLPPVPDPVTYYEHVAPILQENCVACHREGQAAPFSLTSYDDARGWSGMIKFVLREGLMPPWHVSEHFDGEFVNQRGLSARDEALLTRWIESGQEPGDPALGPEPRVWPGAWLLADFDLILEADLQVNWGRKPFLRPLPAEGFTVQAQGVIEYQDFASSHVFTEEQWVTAIEILPTATTVVHHVGAFILDTSIAHRERTPRNEDELRWDERPDWLGAGFFGFYGPGAPAWEAAEGYAKRIPAGSAIRFQVHYTADGSERLDRPRIGLRFALERPRYEVLTGSVSNETFVLPPHASDFELVASRKLAMDVDLVELMPHMHYRGKQFRFLVQHPDGTIHSLLNVDYRFDWQITYTPRTPIRVPAGSTIFGTGVMDNSAGNPSNPDPSREIRFGRLTEDEMFLGYFNYAVPLADPK